MDLIINELSLTGQFQSIEEFIQEKENKGLYAFIHTLNEISKDSKLVLLKKYDFYSSKVTQTDTLHSIITNSEIAHISDLIRKYKRLMSSSFLSAPYWEDDKKHKDEDLFECLGHCVCDTSIAESCERDRCIISFSPSSYSDKKFFVLKNSTPIEIHNILDKEDFYNSLRDLNYLDFETYVTQLFKDSKLDFSLIKEKNKNGLKDIPQEAEAEFIDAFCAFTVTDWAEVGNHNGLRYKPYNITRDNKQYFVGYQNKKIYEFRASSKFRAFGFKEKDSFYLLFIDLEHKLGDL